MQQKGTTSELKQEETKDKSATGTAKNEFANKIIN